MIDWQIINGLHVGMVGGKGVFEIVETCESGCAIVSNIGNPVPYIKDKNNDHYTMETAKARSEEMFEDWLKLAGLKVA